MSFEKAFSLALKLARRFGTPQYLAEWHGDWAISNYYPKTGVRVVTIDLDDFHSVEAKIERPAA